MKALERIAATIFGFAFLALALAVALETIARKIFNRSFQGVDELGGYTLAVGAGLSFAVALASRAHIRIDIVHDHLPRGVRIVLNVLAVTSLAACAIAALVMAVFALQDTIAFNATAQTPWATPLKIPQATWVAALAVFAVLALYEAGRLVTLLLRGDLSAIDRSYGPRGTKDELDAELADLKARGVTADIAAPGDKP